MADSSSVGLSVGPHVAARCVHCGDIHIHVITSNDFELMPQPGGMRWRTDCPVYPGKLFELSISDRELQASLSAARSAAERQQYSCLWMASLV